MKHISLLVVLIVGGLASGLLAAEEPNLPNLDDREVVVRVYKDWKVKPERYGYRIVTLEEPEVLVFEKVTLQLDGNSVPLNSIESTQGQLGKSTVVVIIAEDQNDAVVKKVLDDAIYAQPYEQGLMFSIPNTGNTSSIWLTFNDALGNPIPQATGEIFLADHRNPTKARIRKVLLDARGRMKMPVLTGGLKDLSLIVSHPDYGIALVEEVYPWHRVTHFLPLSKIGTKADERSIWGLVVDPQGNPVQGAVVSGWMAYTPGRGKIRSRVSLNMVMTDPNGRFAMHLPVKKTEEGPTTIPPVCDYKVSVKAPRDLGLMSYSGLVPNGQETTIVLRKRKQREKFFRTFAFVDANGPITDPNRLKEIIIIEGTGHGGRGYGYDSWKDGLMLPAGTFRAAIRTTGPEKHELDRVELTAESPQKIIFRLGNDVAYAGKVVDGITGQAVPGAFIMATGWFRRDFTAVTAEQWAALRELPTYLTGDEPVLEPVRKICDFERIARAEGDGTFYLSFGPSDKFYQLIVFDKDYLHVAHRRDRFEPDEYNYVQLPESRLFPAAKLVIEPYLENPKRNYRLIAWWYIQEDSNPAWAKEIIAYHLTRKASFADLLRRDLVVNRPQIIQVPAGVNMQVRLQYIGRGEGKKRWCPVFTKVFNAGQGERVDLGRYPPFLQEMPVYAEIVDSTGNPLEGVGVRHLDRSGSYFGQTHITDGNGIAEFTVPPYYKGEFCVGYHDESKKFVKQSILYKTTGPKDANSVFTITVSDEILYHLFK